MYEGFARREASREGVGVSMCSVTLIAYSLPDGHESGKQQCSFSNSGAESVWEPVSKFQPYRFANTSAQWATWYAYKGDNGDLQFWRASWPCAGREGVDSSGV